MNLADISIVCGLCSTLLVGGGTAGNYYLQKEYVPIAGLQELFEEQEAMRVRREIRELEWDADHGGLSEKDEYLLEQYRDDLEALQ